MYPDYYSCRVVQEWLFKFSGRQKICRKLLKIVQTLGSNACFYQQLRENGSVPSTYHDSIGSRQTRRVPTEETILQRSAYSAEQLSDHVPLSQLKLYAYMDINLTYNGSYYFCNLILSNNYRQDMLESFARGQNLSIPSALYKTMRSIASTIFLYYIVFFCFFYFPTKF